MSIKLENIQEHLSRRFGFVQDYPARIYPTEELLRFTSDNQLSVEYQQLIAGIRGIKNGNYLCRHFAKNNLIVWQIIDFKDNEKIVFESHFRLGNRWGYEFEFWLIEITLKNKEGQEFQVMSLSLPLIEDNLSSR